jgi:hypothetical protein
VTMDNDEPVDSVLFACFLALDEEQRANLRYHLEKGTRIFCGPGSDTYYLGKGGNGGA